MSDLFVKNSHAIPHGQVLAGVARQAKTVHVASGLAWITIEGTPDDFWLLPGDSLPIMPGKLVVIEAVKGASRIDIRSGYAAAKGGQANTARTAIPQLQTTTA